MITYRERSAKQNALIHFESDFAPLDPEKQMNQAANSANSTNV